MPKYGTSTFATGCGFNKEIVREAICNDEFSGSNVVTTQNFKSCDPENLQNVAFHWSFHLVRSLYFVHNVNIQLKRLKSYHR